MIILVGLWRKFRLVVLLVCGWFYLLWVGLDGLFTDYCIVCFVCVCLYLLVFNVLHVLLVLGILVVACVFVFDDLLCG